jgi:hypothetical protein
MKTRYFLFDSFAINDLKKGIPAKEIADIFGWAFAIGIVTPNDERSLCYCMEQAIKYGTYLEISESDYMMFKSGGKSA